MTPAPGIKLCATAAYSLFHSHAQVLTFTDSTRWTGVYTHHQTTTCSFLSWHWMSTAVEMGRGSEGQHWRGPSNSKAKGPNGTLKMLDEFNPWMKHINRKANLSLKKKKKKEKKIIPRAHMALITFCLIWPLHIQIHFLDWSWKQNCIISVNPHFWNLLTLKTTTTKSCYRPRFTWSYRGQRTASSLSFSDKYISW